MATTIICVEEGKEHCEFCTESPTRMFKAQAQPIVVEFEGRNYISTKPHWLACPYCAECIENNSLVALRNNIESELLSVASGFAPLAPHAPQPPQQTRDWIVRMSFVAMGLPTIRKALEIRSEPIDWPMVRTENAKIIAALGKCCG
jgi:hypothetical protein